MATGGDDVPAGQWDDELSAWPEDRRHVVRRRLAFVTVCVVLITLIILTIVFVGNDKKSSARVTTNEVSTSTLGTIGFATSLPVVATATSFAATTSSTSTTTTTTTTTAPQRSTTTTTTPQSPFEYNPPGPHQNTIPQTYSPADGCAPSPDERFIFDTPVPGRITITRQGNTAGGPVDPQGNFDIKFAQGGAVFDHYVGHTTQTSVTAAYHRTDVTPCDNDYSVTWTFG